MLLTAGMSTLAVSTAMAKEKPNVLIIVADDLGWGDLSYHGGYVDTPNIDRIVSDGIELDRYYAAPVSSPTRCGLMTGRYPSRFGIRQTVIPPWRDYGLDTNEETIADVLGRHGYENRAAIGKWHLGHSRWSYYPLNRGFTHFYGCLNGALDYFTHMREGELDWHNDWDSCYDEGYSTDLIAAEAAKCIREYTDGAPYFLYVAFNAPHSPYEAPQDELDSLISPEEFDKLPPKDKKGWTYRAMVSRMDKGVGLIMKTLEESGEMDNTIVLFMSDNGGTPGMEPYCTNRPLRGTKFEEFEGGVRVCAAIRWKKGFRGGWISQQVTGFVDVLPTLCDAIGIKETPKNPYDGISVLPALKNRKKSIERDIYLGVGAAVNQKHKLIVAGKNKGLHLNRDLFVDIEENPGESPKMRSTDSVALRHLAAVVQEGDAIVPYRKELPYGFGKDGFVAPVEWKPDITADVEESFGFYRLPSSDEMFYFVAPSSEKASIVLSGGKTFTVIADGYSDKNRFIQGVELNGVKYDKDHISKSEILRGGYLRFIMGEKPQR